MLSSPCRAARPTGTRGALLQLFKMCDVTWRLCVCVADPEQRLLLDNYEHFPAPFSEVEERRRQSSLSDSTSLASPPNASPLGRCSVCVWCVSCVCTFAFHFCVCTYLSSGYMLCVCLVCVRALCLCVCFSLLCACHLGMCSVCVLCVYVPSGYVPCACLLLVCVCFSLLCVCSLGCHLHSHGHSDFSFNPHKTDSMFSELLTCFNQTFCPGKMRPVQIQL